ncbi:MAG: dihydrodipicolinate synthase family protein [Nitriliruptoraceae bacterium]|nr:dihydrodipicolinate synthase family protein [Nitriliruptoraceae bacterium]
MSSPSLTGSIPALVTPLDADRQPDEDGLRRLIRRALDDGASGVLVAGTTGEGSLLSPAHRAAVTASARSALGPAGPGVPTLLAGAVGLHVEGLQDDVRRVADAGADAVLVLPPGIQPLTPDEVVDLHLAVAESSPVPTLAYHIPQLTGSWLVPEVLPRLAGHERIIGMKDSSPDAERRAGFAAFTRDNDGLALLTGHASSLAAALDAGVDGSILAVANLRQRGIVALHAAHAAGDTAEVERRQEVLRRTTEGLATTGASVPAAIKAALQLDGVLRERWCVPPLRSVEPARLDHIRTMLVR